MSHNESNQRVSFMEALWYSEQELITVTEDTVSDDYRPKGALYPDGTSDRLKQDDSVGPGASYTYRWEVRPEFSPTEGDAACLTWVYHSHVEAPRDITSGLIGALLTCKKGILTEEGRVDVDRDVVLMFNVVDESLSWYQEHNIQTFCSDPASVDPADPDFQESNMMHGG
nr:unnamed protein product [Salmo salar]|eukprot:XP_013998673.1 PREDICTED: hephaestin-like protein 1 [Salmo salar]